MSFQQKRDPVMWNRYQTTVVDFIRNTLGLGDKFSSDQVCNSLVKSFYKCHNIPNMLCDFRSTDASASSGRTGYL